MEDALRQRIANETKLNPVFIYMKGTPSFPVCGFSKTAVEILANYDVEFGFADILSEPGLRDACKEYFDWPTYPMLIVKGDLIGGVDIMKELHAQGALKAVLGA